MDVIGELLRKPLTEFPHVTIANELTASFHIVALSWHWRESDRTIGFELFPPLEDWVPDQYESQFHSGEMIDRHPLIHWFSATGSPNPQSIGRVPDAIAPRRDRAIVDAILRPLNCEEQLSIPYVLDGICHRAFVLARTDGDFSDDDLEVSRRLQPLLRGLDIQARVLGSDPTRADAISQRAVDLTGRELAVLCLLAEGHTAYGIARRLSISPRTVEKHLEHVYRKLKVNDRLAAARIAHELRLDVRSSNGRRADRGAAQAGRQTSGGRMR